jgi:hypothetical protein
MQVMKELAEVFTGLEESNHTDYSMMPEKIILQATKRIIQEAGIKIEIACDQNYTLYSWACRRLFR